MKDSFTQDDIVKYNKLIASFVRTAISSTEGAVDSVANPNVKGWASLASSKNFHTYYSNNAVTIDVSVSIIYGYSTPKIVCEIQDKIKQSLSKHTDLRVSDINIDVCGVIFI